MVYSKGTNYRRETPILFRDVHEWVSGKGLEWKKRENVGKGTRDRGVRKKVEVLEGERLGRRRYGRGLSPEEVYHRGVCPKVLELLLREERDQVRDCE